MKKATALLVGDKFKKLTVVGFLEMDKKYGQLYVCMCDCGNKKIVRRTDLINGMVRSCGCLLKERYGKLKLPDNARFINSIITNYKTHAKKLDVCWDLTFDIIKELIAKPCFYCGVLNSNTYTGHDDKQRKFSYNGIDRLNSELGYSIDNCVPCCIVCNKAKLKRSKEEFLSWVRRVFIHSFNGR